MNFITIFRRTTLVFALIFVLPLLFIWDFADNCIDAIRDLWDSTCDFFLELPATVRDYWNTHG